jgi:polycystin 2
MKRSKFIALNVICSRGHADAEIEAVFAKYDLDGDRILDEDEQRRMQEDLEGQKVNVIFF